MCNYNSNKFEEAFNNGSDVNTLLKALDTTILKMATRFYKKFSYYIDQEDIAQEVRIYIWKVIKETDYLKNMTGAEAYKYLVTVIRVSTFRAIKRQAAIVQRQNRTGEDTYVDLLALSVLNVEFLSNIAETPCEVFVDRLREMCVDIENADIVFNYLAPSEDLGGTDEEKFINLPVRTLQKVTSLIKEKVKELDYE